MNVLFYFPLSQNKSSQRFHFLPNDLHLSLIYVCVSVSRVDN